MFGDRGGCPFRPKETAAWRLCEQRVGGEERRRRRGGWKLRVGVAGARTSAVLLLLSILLQLCRCQRDTDHMIPNTDQPPHFLSTPQKVTVREGNMAILPCAVRYLGPTQVAWRKMGEKSKSFLTLGTFVWLQGTNMLVEHHQDPGYVSHWNLLIKKVRKDQAGKYECQITTKEKMVRIVTLVVIGPRFTEPAISMKGKMFVNLGDPIHLTCNATGGTQIPEDIDWFKDGSKIDTHRQKGLVITKFRSIEQQALISELIIDRSRERDKGTYICRSSAEKIDSLIVTILVSGKPNVEKREDKQGSTSDNQVDGNSTASTLSVWSRWTAPLWILSASYLLT